MCSPCYYRLSCPKIGLCMRKQTQAYMMGSVATGGPESVAWTGSGLQQQHLRCTCLRESWCEADLKPGPSSCRRGERRAARCASCAALRETQLQWPQDAGKSSFRLPLSVKWTVNMSAASHVEALGGLVRALLMLLANGLSILLSCVSALLSLHATSKSLVNYAKERVEPEGKTVFLTGKSRA